MKTKIQKSKRTIETYFENLSTLRLSVKTSFFEAGPNAAGVFFFVSIKCVFKCKMRFECKQNRLFELALMPQALFFP